MKSTSIAFACLLALTASTTGAAPAKCCTTCNATAGLQKYYSVANNPTARRTQCGESCIDPSKFKLYHLFEHNLTLATTTNPCAGFGFTEYLETDTHGFGPIKATLDMYKFPSVASESSCDSQCKQTCCRNGGGDACVTACGCSGPCASLASSVASSAMSATCTAKPESCSGTCTIKEAAPVKGGDLHIDVSGSCVTDTVTSATYDIKLVFNGLPVVSKKGQNANTEHTFNLPLKMGSVVIPAVKLPVAAGTKILMPGIAHVGKFAPNGKLTATISAFDQAKEALFSFEVDVSL